MASIARGWRFEEEIIRTLKRRSDVSGETQTEIVTRALRNELGLAPAVSRAGGRLSGSTTTPAAAGSAPVQAPPAEVPSEQRMVHLPTWLQGKTQLPRAACRAMIHRSAVKIGGEVVTDLEVPYLSLSHGVEVSGQVHYP